MRSLRRGATLCAAGLTAFAVVANSPAWADSSTIVWCEYGQKGRTFWRDPDNVDSITWFHGMWVHRSNPGVVVHGEQQGIAYEAPTNIEIWGQGTHEWLVYGVVVHTDRWLHRGGRCEGDPKLANAAYDATPQLLTGRLSPPPLNVGQLDTRTITDQIRPE